LLDVPTDYIEGDCLTKVVLLFEQLLQFFIEHLVKVVVVLLPKLFKHSFFEA
jgi:hypothetical protein